MIASPFTSFLILELHPSELGTWTKLRILAIGFCGFSSSLPDSIGNWGITFRFFSISDNNLTVGLPSSIKNWSATETFHVYGNDFVGNPLLNGQLGGRGIRDIQMELNDFTRTLDLL